eukprot:2223676-Amphidinium_carterae.1
MLAWGDVCRRQVKELCVFTVVVQEPGLDLGPLVLEIDEALRSVRGSWHPCSSLKLFESSASDLHE